MVKMEPFLSNKQTQTELFYMTTMEEVISFLLSVVVKMEPNLEYCLNVLLPQLFQKNGYDLNDYNSVRDILYNTDVIINTVKSTVHSPVGKLM